MRDLRHLSPDQITMDLVLRWSTGMPNIGRARVMSHVANSLVGCAVNHRGAIVTFSIPEVFFDGEPDDELPRFVLRRLGSGVWKLAPSIVMPGLLHAFVTIIDVPEPPPWTNVTLG